MRGNCGAVEVAKLNAQQCVEAQRRLCGENRDQQADANSVLQCQSCGEARPLCQGVIELFY